MAKITNAQIEELIPQKNGNVAAVARALGVSRRAVTKRIEKSVRLQELLEDERELMLDNVESVLYSKALAGETAEMIFFLKTQGKKRGYTERQEHEVDANLSGSIDIQTSVLNSLQKAYGDNGNG